VKQLEALSKKPPTLEEVTQLVDCDKVWVDFDEVCTRAKTWRGSGYGSPEPVQPPHDGNYIIQELAVTWCHCKLHI